MRQLRIKGLVREANRIRQALAAPLTPAQRDELADQRDASLRRIDAILRQHNSSPAHLPAPSRRAYEFISQMDLTKVKLVDIPGAVVDRSAAPESVTYRGLRAFLDQVLDDIAMGLAEGRFNSSATFRVIRQTAERLAYGMHRDGFGPEQLKPESRHLVGWFRHFGEQDAFNAYVKAVERAQSAFASLPAAETVWSPPLLVHFRPSSHLYRWRVYRDGTRIVLLTPMIAFDKEALRCLGQQMLGRKRHWPAVNAAMMAEPYQVISAELEASAGAVERTRGMGFDLAEVFERVNRKYFHGRLSRPKLSWTPTLTGTTFGHYDFVHDRLCISSTLDRPDVPAYVLDHVMHHELLHKKLGFKWRGTRQHTHTRAFRVEERAFPQYTQAARYLNESGVDPCRTPKWTDNG